MKKLLSLALMVLLVFSMVGCGKNKLTDEEKKQQGYKTYKDLGLEFKMGETWKTYDDNLTLGGIGDAENEEEPIYGGLDYGFISNKLIEEYYDVTENVEDPEERGKRYNEIFSKVKGLITFVIFREDKVPAEDKIAEVTERKHNEKIDDHDGLVFYFCYDDYDDEGLSEEAKKAYKELYDDIQNVKESVITSKPVTPQEAINGLKKIEFKLKDINGNEVTNDIFKNSKLTMINIWATFCGPCIKEMPDLQALHEDLNSEGVSIFGIIGDTPDVDNEAAAKEIIETKGVKFASVIPDDDMKENLISSIAGYPTSLFVDSEGKIVGEVITGSRSKEEYKEIILKTLEALK